MNRFLGIFIATSFAISATQAQNCDSSYVLSLKLFDQKAYQSSLVTITSVITSCPADTSYYLHQAKCYAQLKNAVGTMDALNNAIKTDSTCVNAWATKASLLAEAGLYEQAITAYEKTLALLPPNDTIRKIHCIDLSALYISTSRFDDAYFLLNDLCHKDSTDEKMLTNLSACAIYSGRIDQAEWSLSKFMAINKNNVDCIINMGFCKEYKQEYDSAIYYYDQALRTNPNEAYALNNRGHAKYALGEYDAALADINLALTFDPSNAYAYRNRALVNFAIGLDDNACSDLQTALDLGYTTMYGDEVSQLQHEKCGKHGKKRKLKK